MNPLDTPAPDTPAPGTSALDVPAAAAEWGRLDVRMLVVYPVRQLIGLLPLLLVLLITGRGGGWQLWIAIGTPVAVIISGALRWYTTRYRVTPERVELHSGLLNRQQRSLPRDRVRTVDITASPFHRIFGLSVVRVGAGAGDPTANAVGLSLDAVPTAEAERLRLALLHRASPTPTLTRPGPEIAEAATLPAATTQQGEVIATLRWSWLRFAPLTTSGLVAVAALTGAAFNFANELRLLPTDFGAVRRAGEGLSGVPLTLAVALVATGVLLIAAIGSVLIYVEGWSGYRLTREPDGTLLVRRGLLTTRALSVEERRLRGAEVTEPLLLRAGRGARCSAVTTGLGVRSGAGALLPPAPRAQAHRVAAAALRTDPGRATGASLARHPRAALTRRLTRAVLPAALLVALASALDARLPASWLAALWPAALALLPVAVLLGLDRYRNLGHALSEDHFVTRTGSLLRRTVALQRGGIIGWRLRQSVFQRRVGLVTLDAVTAAGAGSYPAVDVSFERAMHVVDRVNPGLLPPR